MAKLIFGAGYLGKRVARRWREEGQTVHLVTRSSQRAAAWQAEGFCTTVADIATPASMAELPAADTVLYAVGYEKNSTQSIEQVFAGGLQTVLAALTGSPRVIYISSTGVYGQTDGGWIDEDSPCQPVREGGLAALAAERCLAAHRLGRNGIVLRMAGLYGPGRIPLAAQLRAGQRLAVSGDSFLNLMHVDDAAEVVRLAARLPALSDGPRRYCASDGRPVARREYCERLAELLGAPPPVFSPPESDATAASPAGNKRVSNRRLLRELRPSFRFASYRAGLASALAEPLD